MLEVTDVLYVATVEFVCATKKVEIANNFLRRSSSNSTQGDVVEGKDTSDGG